MQKESRIEREWTNSLSPSTRRRDTPLNLQISFKIKPWKQFCKDNVWTKNNWKDLTTVSSQKMVSSAAKRKIKTKDDKMLTLERYFESCGRDLSKTLSWTKWYGLYLNLALAVTSRARKRDFSELWQPPSKKKIWQTRPEQHRSPNSDSSQTLLGTI